MCQSVVRNSSPRKTRASTLIYNEDLKEKESTMTEDDRDFLVPENANLGGVDDHTELGRELNELPRCRTVEALTSDRSVLL
mmetsp:Transcript_27345/g.46215  ORF Transcript_27345/g.46215 Transcript_27345/m.46215 type:complete len:81 (+) Transcript_27345:140-382(+)